jgi:glycosyltransferase involved in cell wall biosynthesis
LTKGDRLRAYYQIRELSKTHDVYLISTNENEPSQESIEKLKLYCKEIHVFKLSKIKILFSLFYTFFSTKPFQVAYFFQYSISQKISRLLREISPDHLFCQLIRGSEYVKNYHECPKTIDYMDAMSKGMERRYESSHVFYKLIFKIESKRLKEYERKIFDYFEYHLIISEQDKKFIFHPNFKNIQVIPNGIDESFFSPFLIEKENDVVFVGNLSYEPNIQATEYLYKHIHKNLPTLKIQITGANPSKRVLKLQEDNFRVTGYVEDIRSAYSGGKIFVAPMFIGTGLQNKLLEAMAQGIPCITTSLANNALEAENKKEILLANSESEFITLISSILLDKNKYTEIQANARKYVYQNFSWSAINKELLEKIKL